MNPEGDFKVKKEFEGLSKVGRAEKTLWFAYATLEL